MRYSINGEVWVFIVVIRDILKGERFYYDYNGYEYVYFIYYFLWLFSLDSLIRVFGLIVFLFYFDVIYWLVKKGIDLMYGYWRG